MADFKNLIIDYSSLWQAHTNYVHGWFSTYRTTRVFQMYSMYSMIKRWHRFDFIYLHNVHWRQLGYGVGWVKISILPYCVIQDPTKNSNCGLKTWKYFVNLQKRNLKSDFRKKNNPLIPGHREGRILSSHFQQRLLRATAVFAPWSIFMRI